MSDAVTKPEGHAYGRRAQHSSKLLTEVGPGTPMGELMRRYWQPVALSREVTDLPRKVKVLGEDLIVFRDRRGRAGLLYPRCMHRGTSLFYGKIEDEGIRCCYHGWLFDTQGRCLDQPCEPDRGRHRDAARQPWYPVEERYGLIFAYLGPPARKPVLPRYDILEEIRPDQQLLTLLGGFGSTGDLSLEVTPYSWLHMNDNVMDPFHVHVLHSTFTGPQFASGFLVMPTVDFFHIDAGVCYSAHRKLDDGREMQRVSTWLMPNIMSVPDISLEHGPSNMMSWVVPCDDSSYRQAMVMKLPRSFAVSEEWGIKLGGKRWGEMTEEEHQRTPGDFEAQAGQGPISLHSEEHLVMSDRGIIMQRKVLQQQCELVANGGDPVGVAFEADKALVRVPSGNFYEHKSAVG
ncbi:MAG TPA: Rieske 2Fe-2S domain-containing protein [Steroidobacteraceae bacterium]|jgi:phenylpropionate dioxygenase-like ring-hydroxylating dioxygenase large terminal subunit|nr:Rieske 2Fe-2S domain-containing protein [Steroidobacteraceae bacterium]